MGAGELSALLPPGVAVAEAFGDGRYRLWDEEAPLVANATAARRA